MQQSLTCVCADVKEFIRSFVMFLKNRKVVLHAFLFCAVY